MKPKKQKDFYEAHRAELIPYEAAQRYLKGVMNGKTGLPIKAWKTERDKLNADRKRLNGEYVSLKNEIVEVEKIRKNVYEIMREDTKTHKDTRYRIVKCKNGA
ncbi:MAG: hypothetical protein LIO58_00900 [Oscillospiraceae bacterium]|nr:hypothetical protein [Oscillospiraceae bacterium]